MWGQACCGPLVLQAVVAMHSSHEFSLLLTQHILGLNTCMLCLKYDALAYSGAIHHKETRLQLRWHLLKGESSTTVQNQARTQPFKLFHYS